LNSSPSSHNGADWSIPSNIAPRVNKQVCIEKAVQQTMNSNFGSAVQMIKTGCKGRKQKKTEKRGSRTGPFRRKRGQANGVKS